MQKLAKDLRAWVDWIYFNGDETPIVDIWLDHSTGRVGIVVLSGDRSVDHKHLVHIPMNQPVQLVPTLIGFFGQSG